MKNILATIILSIVGTLLFHSPLFSQDSSIVDRRVNGLRTRLSLTDDQTIKVKEILEQSFLQMQEDREKYQGNRESMMEIMRERTRANDDSIKVILTDEQKKTYEQMIEERKNRRGRFGNQ